MMTTIAASSKPQKANMFNDDHYRRQFYWLEAAVLRDEICENNNEMAKLEAKLRELRAENEEHTVRLSDLLHNVVEWTQSSEKPEVTASGGPTSRKPCTPFTRFSSKRHVQKKNEAGFMVGDRVCERDGQKLGPGTVVDVTPCYIYIDLDGSHAQIRRHHNTLWKKIDPSTDHSA
jgi:tetrahydrodipicolinate N-succinyltransferase